MLTESAAQLWCPPPVEHFIEETDTLVLITS